MNAYIIATRLVAFIGELEEMGFFVRPTEILSSDECADFVISNPANKHDQWIVGYSDAHGWEVLPA